jgi:hypothetical protein
MQLKQKGLGAWFTLNAKPQYHKKFFKKIERKKSKND